MATREFLRTLRKFYAASVRFCRDLGWAAWVAARRQEPRQLPRQVQARLLAQQLLRPRDVLHPREAIVALAKAFPQPVDPCFDDWPEPVSQKRRILISGRSAMSVSR